jgi:type IX secretion system PorP/SprF family membrane protein
MKKTIFKIIFGLGVLTAADVLAQDIHFSQFDETPLQLNPANTGTSHELRAIANYKSQWQSVNAPFKTFAISVDGRALKKKKNQLGIGLNFFSDNSGAGQLKTNQVNLSLSGIVMLNEHNRLSGGVMGGYAQRSINTNSYQWGNQYDGQSYSSQLPTGENGFGSNFSYVDLAAGITYNYASAQTDISANDQKRVNIGVSVFHPHNPAYSFYGDATRLYAKFVFHGDAAFGISNTNLVLKPSYIVFLQGPTKEITPGMMMQYVLQGVTKYTGNKKFTAISIGGYYRALDAAIVAAKFEYDNCALGVSYDINLSKLTAVSSSRGGLEISLRVAYNRFKRGASPSSFY